jgi:hypothetical protein
LTGTFQDQVGSALCKDCPIGQFNPGTEEKHSCANCTRGKHQGREGAASCDSK